jgi:hypothetical protein
VGLRIASLILMRCSQNHHIRCRSGFPTETLTSRIVRGSCGACGGHLLGDPEGRESNVAITLLPFAAAPNGNLQLVIGEECSGRDEFGQVTERETAS